MSTATMDPPVEGTQQEPTGQLSWTVGGKAPTDATLSLTGAKFEVSDDLEKGEALSVVVKRADGSLVFDGEAFITAVSFRDEIDKATGQAVGCVRQHTARVETD
jgi:hypothetical protein